MMVMVILMEKVMTEEEELYETIFCSQHGQEHRKELLEKYKDKLPDLKIEHEKSGIKINNRSILLEDII